MGAISDSRGPWHRNLVTLTDEERLRVRKLIVTHGVGKSIKLLGVTADTLNALRANPAIVAPEVHRRVMARLEVVLAGGKP